MKKTMSYIMINILAQIPYPLQIITLPLESYVFH